MSRALTTSLSPATLPGMALTVDLETGRTACLDSITGLVQAAESLSEHDLLGPSRCHGWTRLDAVVHVVGGWQEMLTGLVCLVDEEPTVDAAAYWPEFAAAFGGGDPVPALMAQRRRTAAYLRPADAVEQLREVAESLGRAVASLVDRCCAWQGHVFAPGDYLAIWAVEHAVHHLDLRCSVPVPPSALSLARATVEALAGPLPAGWDDERAVLVGAGRVPVPDGLGETAARLPALG